MAKYLLLAALVLSSALALPAATIDCGTMNLLVTTPAATCSITYASSPYSPTSTMMFSNFGFSSSLNTGSLGLITDLMVEVLLTSNNPNEVVITFRPVTGPGTAWPTISGIAIGDVYVDYEVTVANSLVNGATAYLTDSFTTSGSHSGTATQSKSICLRGPCGTTPPVDGANVNDLNGTAGVIQTYSSAASGGWLASDFWVRDRLNYSGNGPFGSTSSVTVYSFADKFASVNIPEPETYVLVGGGLLLLGLLSRRFRRA